MFNAPLLFETGLLMLAAFLAGALVGTGARWLASRQKPATPAAVAVPQPTATPGAPQLVVAPEIAPVGARPTVAARIAAAAEGRSAAASPSGLSQTIAMPKSELPEMPALGAIKPSHQAGETVDGRHIDNPEHQATSPAEPVPEATSPVVPAVSEPVPPPAALEPVLVARPADQVVTPDEAPETDSEIEQTSDETIVHIEPSVAPDSLVVRDGPVQTAALLQETHPAAPGTPAPAVTAETPLVEPEVEREAAEDDESLLDRVEPEDEPETQRQSEPETAIAAALPEDAAIPEASPTQPIATQPSEAAQSESVPSAPEPAEPVTALEPEMTEAEAELAAMQAIERGWTPRATTAPRMAADLPEGVSVEETEAAGKAVANSGAAVASAAARAAAILQEISVAPEPANDAGPPSPETSETAAGPGTSPDGAVEARSARTAGGFGRPAALDAPRDGVRDDLGQIRGISPTIASALNGLGIYHFDQIADWDQKAVVWVENHFGFKGRIARERWQDQARDLGRGRPPLARRPVRR